MNTRQLSIRADSTNRAQRSVTATLATADPVAVFDYRTGRVVLESLHIPGVEVKDKVPMLTDHARSVPSTIGSASDFDASADRLRGILRFASGTLAGDEAWALVDQGHLDSVSVGYHVREFQELRAGESKVISGKLYQAPANEPLRVVTRWQLKEISLVPIPADPGAKIGRSSLSVLTRSQSMSTGHTQVSRAIPDRDISGMTLPDLASHILRRMNQPIPENHLDMCRAAFSTADGTAELAGIVNAAILDGFRAVPDSLAGVYRAVDVPNYLAGELAALNVHPRMFRVGRGDVAPAASFGVSSTGYRLARFGVQFCVDEQDYEDLARIRTYQVALAEIGASVRRLVSDLLWSTLLSNPELGDGTTLFHADRSNLSANALSDANLDTGMAAIASQTSETEDEAPVHLALTPRYLITPPSLYGLAARLNVAMDAGSGPPLVVRPESRLSTAGVFDPLSESTIEANGTSWLLAAPGEQAAGIVLALLNGQTEPRIRSYELDQGEWGTGFDVSFSCAAAAVDGRPLYWSSGQ